MTLLEFPGMLRNHISRRRFIKTAGATAALGWTMPRLAAQEHKWPSDQLTFAYVGTGVRYHTALGHQTYPFGPCAGICDVDAVQRGRAQQIARDYHRENGRAEMIPLYEDYRRIIDRDDIDVVLIGTPDHWHTKIAIEAMKAGKDVYCEKPLTLTIKEGQQFEQVMNETKRVVQVGTQQRTEFGSRFATAAAMVRDGRIGKLKKITCAIGSSPVCEPLPKAPVPNYLNWELWQGQAPEAEYRQGEYLHPDGWGAGYPQGRTHRYFRWFYEYSGGKLTDWGAHHVDIALWAIDRLNGNLGTFTIDPVDFEHPVEFKDGMPLTDDRFNCASRFKISVMLDDGVELQIRDSADDLGFPNGIMFEGTEGRFLVNRGKIVGRPVEALKENPLAEDAFAKLYGTEKPKSHMQNFMDCIQSRDQPISDVASHNQMLAVCHGANIAMRLGRKLTFDAQNMTFVGDDQANSFIEREQRKGYEITV
jgi:predicted dehydrogenase